MDTKTVTYDDGPKEKDYFHSGVSLHFRPVVLCYSLTKIEENTTYLSAHEYKLSFRNDFNIM